MILCRRHAREASATASGATSVIVSIVPASRSSPWRAWLAGARLFARMRAAPPAVARRIAAATPDCGFARGTAVGGVAGAQQVAMRQQRRLAYRSTHHGSGATSSRRAARSHCRRGSRGAVHEEHRHAAVGQRFQLCRDVLAGLDGSSSPPRPRTGRRGCTALLLACFGIDEVAEQVRDFRPTDRVQVGDESVVIARL